MQQNILLKKEQIDVKKDFTLSESSGIFLTNNEIKDVIKVIKYLEDRGILLKGTIRKINSLEGGFLNFLRSSMTAGLPLMKNVLTPLTKSILISLGLSAGMSAADAVIWKKIDGSGTTALLISNEEMNDVMRIVKSLEESGLLIKGVSKTIKNETKEQKIGFFSMLLEILVASISGNALAGKGVIRTGEGTIRTGEGTIRAGQDF